jgi:7,8-dihydropterin-6-yl-methyl-4-(beta-D-ribofuranosyl)aminobenzene 5'-phosphate synthase
VRKAIRVILGVVIALAATVGGYSAFQTVQHNQAAAEIERESPVAGITRLANVGTTRTLEILPLVEKAAAGPQYQAEHGVAYLLKTDAATILLDLGFNEAGSDPSPLEHNMAQLGVTVADIDTIVISHWHPDHTGGRKFWERHTFALGNRQLPLSGPQAYVPSPMTYPDLSPLVVGQPIKIAEGVASIGILPFTEVMDTAGLPTRNTEQALAVNVAGRGVVLVVGCGHPGLPKLVARTQAAFAEPVVGVVGGLHLTGASDTIVQGDVALLQGLHAHLVGLSPHDSDASVIERFRTALPAVYRDVMVGRAIRLADSGL